MKYKDFFVDELNEFNLPTHKDEYSYIGNCLDEDLVDSLFGSVTDFARLVEENGDNFFYNGIKVIYDKNKDIHHFYKDENYENSINEGFQIGDTVKTVARGSNIVGKVVKIGKPQPSRYDDWDKVIITVELPNGKRKLFNQMYLKKVDKKVDENDIDILDEKFKKLQHLQRGIPEQMFDEKYNPGASHSGKAQWAMEHTGDLIHRASYPKNDIGWGGGTWEYGLESTLEKAKKLLIALDDDDTYIEQARRNWNYEIKNGYTKLPEEKYVTMVISALDRYADEYEKLPVYTELQKYAKNAAISLGRRNWTEYRKQLKNIITLLNKGESGYFSYLQNNLNEGFKDLAAASLIGLSTLGGINADAKETKPPQTQTISYDSSTFNDYIKRVENGIRKGWNRKEKRWYPHKSFEGGNDTIAYGHKIKKGENFSGGITEQEALQLLEQDLARAKRIVYKELGNVKLTQKQEDMLVDFAFNMGTLKKFPRFVEAVLKNDIKTMVKQYKRFSNKQPLINRNAEFYNRFLS